MATTMGYNISFDTNFTISPVHDDLSSFLKTLRLIFAISVFVLTPVIVVANLILISSIVTNPRLRNELRYRVIVSIAVADFLIGLLSCPIRGETVLAMEFKHHCLTLLIVSLVEEYVQITVATWGIVTVNFDYLFTLFQVKLPEISPRKHTLVISAILLLPWIAMLFIILPAVSAHFQESYDLYRVCYLFIRSVTAHVVVPMTFIIPGFIIVCQNAIMAGVYCMQKQTHHGTQSLLTSPWIFVVAGFVTIGLVGIEQCAHMSQKLILKLAFRKGMYALYYSAVLLSDSKSAVTPLLWFALPELRAAFMDLFNRLPWRRDRRRNVAETSVTYRQMSDTV